MTVKNLFLRGAFYSMQYKKKLNKKITNFAPMSIESITASPCRYAKPLYGEKKEKEIEKGR